MLQIGHSLFFPPDFGIIRRKDDKIMLRDKSVTEFTELIASTAPAPGGGGASAAVAAIAVALGDMVGELTVGKKKYADVEDDIRKIMERAQKLRVRLLELIDEDDENFTPLSKAYAIPKDAPGRDEEMERCLKLAVSAPLELLRICCEIIDMQDELARKGSKLMVSDAATGVAFARGALMGAAANIKVNTKLMKDRRYAATIDAETDFYLKMYSDKADRIFHFVYDDFTVK